MRREPLVTDCRSYGLSPGMAAFDIMAPNTFILDRQGAAAPIYRFAGSAIQHFIGANPQGKEFYHYWDAEAREMLAWYFDLSAENGTAFRLASTRSETGAPDCETVLMPVGDADAGNMRFIGVSVARDSASRNSAPALQHIQHIAFLDGALTAKNVRGHLPLVSAAKARATR